MSLILGEMLAFEAYMYNFLILDCIKVFFLTMSKGLLIGGGGSILVKDVVREAATIASSLELLTSLGREEDVVLLILLLLSENLFLTKLLIELPVFLLYTIKSHLNI